MYRLRIGHTWLTHSFILRKEPLPLCTYCGANLTIKHLLLECTHLNFQSNSFFNKRNLFDLFRDVEPNRILGFLKQTSFYNKL